MSHTANIRAAFSDAARALGIPEGARICAALSGGSDSVTLTHCALSLGYGVCAAHVNHRIRAGEAERDRDFCIEFCKKHGIELFIGEFDVPEIAEAEGKTLEEAARDVRYAFFDEICEKENILYLATAHNARDNLETVLFNLSRGSAGRGMCGIPQTRPLGGRANVVRPLLRCSKEDILGYIEENSLAYVTDSTNADTAYTRNYIRAELIPRLCHLNPSVEYAAARMCESLRRDMDYLDDEASALPNTLDIKALRELAAPLLSRYIALRFAQYSAAALENVHIEAVAGLIRRFDGRTVCSALPGGVAARISSAGLEFVEDRRLPSAYCAPDDVALCEDTLTYFPADGSHLYLSAQDDEKSEKYIKDHINIYKLFIHKQVSFDKIIGTLYIRTRRQGDVYRLRGVGRSLRKLMNELAIPADIRDRVPLVCAGEEIIWLPGAEVSDNVYKNPVSGNIFNIYYIK